MTITLYGAPVTRSHRVSWLLEELGLEWQYHYVDMRAGAHRSAEYLAINPAGKVPALQDDKLLLIESSAICLYLAERYGNGRLLPATGSREQALHHQWISFINGELEQALWSIGKHKFALPAEWRVKAMLDIAPKEFAKALGVAELWIPEHGQLLGDELTVADILLAHTLIWARAFKQPLTPKASDFCERMSQRTQLAAAAAKELAAKDEH